MICIYCRYTYYRKKDYVRTALSSDIYTTVSFDGGMGMPSPQGVSGPGSGVADIRTGLPVCPEMPSLQSPSVSRRHTNSTAGSGR